MTKRLKIVILSGGPSAEHDFSLASGQGAAAGFDPEKYEVIGVLIDREGHWSADWKDLADADLFFSTLRGRYGEDGELQNFFEEKKVPYAGSGPLTSALVSNKFLTLKTLADHGFTVPFTLLVGKEEWGAAPTPVLLNIKNHIGYPIVVKPNDQGSSLGVSLANNDWEFNVALNEIFHLSRSAIIQPFVAGQEVVCGVVDFGNSESAYPLWPLEIIPLKGDKIFHTQAKNFQDNNWLIRGATLPGPIVETIKKTALTVHKTLGCRHFSMVDMIWGQDKRLYVLETNTAPVMGENSLFGHSAAAYGKAFDVMMEGMTESARKK